MQTYTRFHLRVLGDVIKGPAQRVGARVMARKQHGDNVINQLLIVHIRRRNLPKRKLKKEDGLTDAWIDGRMHGCMDA